MSENTITGENKEPSDNVPETQNIKAKEDTKEISEKVSTINSSTNNDASKSSNNVYEKETLSNIPKPNNDEKIEKKEVNETQEEEEEDEEDIEDDKTELIIDNSESTTPRNTNSPVTPDSKIKKSNSTTTRKSYGRRESVFSKEKELFMRREKKKQQEKNEKNKVRYLTEEEINLAFQWFTHGKSMITSEDVKDRFDTFFTNVSKNDKKYYVVGGIKQDTRHLVNLKEEKSQSEMFKSTQSISSLKKMLLKYPFKIKDYDNAFSILCDGNTNDILSEKTLNKYVNLFKDNKVPVKNDIDKVLRCFDRDKDGQLGIQDLFKMKLSDLKKISDDFI